MNLVRTRDGHNYLTPFLLVTTLFFLWGFAHSILDVLNKYFQDALHLTKTESAFIQVVVYGGYFLMALPAGSWWKRAPIGDMNSWPNWKMTSTCASSRRMWTICTSAPALRRCCTCTAN